MERNFRLYFKLNQDKYPSKLVLFITDHPTIMLFNVLIAGLIFVGAETKTVRSL